jgi:DNA-binding protein H-NS
MSKSQDETLHGTRSNMPRQISVAAIKARIRALEAQARRLEREATKGLRAVAAIISKHGLSLSQVQQAFGMSKGGSKRRTTAGRPVAIKYKDEKGNTWTGRGRSPLWLVAAEKAGKKRESFLVDMKRAKRNSAKPKKAAKKSTPKRAAETAAA